MATTIQLQNAGFEALEQTTTPIPPAGFFDFVTPPGWQVYDPNHLIPISNPGLDTSFTGSWKPSMNFFQEIPEGDQIASIFLGRDRNGNSVAGRGKVGLAQTSNEKIQANTTYTLSAAILDTTGQDFSFFSGSPGYELQLVAGDKVLASTKSDDLLSDGSITQDSVSFTTSTSGNYLGEKLGIRLINSNENNGSNPTDGGNGIEVNFDDVKLTSAPVRLASLGLSLEESQQPVPPQDTTSTGNFDVTLLGNELRVEGSFSDLTSDLFFVGGPDPVGNPESPIHIHIGKAGANGPILRNLSVKDHGDGSGTFTGRFTLSEEEVALAKADGLYINVHTLNNLGGELRGQIDVPPLAGDFGGVVGDPQEGTDGRDILRGDHGNDLIFGNGGRDFILGCRGDDRLYGGADRDVVIGGKGDDRLYGDEGRDFLSGGWGNDTLSGGDDTDTLIGRRGHDALNGEDGRDFLLGGDDNDTLNGGDDRDILFGGRGHDRLHGGKGKDKLFGGLGRDTFVLERGHGTDTILDFREGTDLIDLSDDLSFGVGGNVSQVGNTLVFNRGSEDQEVLAVLDHFRGYMDTTSFV